MRKYPIGSFMFWKVTKEDIKENYKFYYFINNFTKRFGDKNVEASRASKSNDFIAVIDGQQRRTALYIGLSGTYRDKKANKRWKDDEYSMPTQYLYLDLNSESDTDGQKKYNFCFKTKAEAENDIMHFWFKVEEIFGRDQTFVDSYLASHNLSSNNFAVSALGDLCKIVNEAKLINYFLIEEQDQDKVLDRFIRANSGGTPLSFSDLLRSILSANWDNDFGARMERDKLIEEIGKHGNPAFEVSQDFILKAMLVLSDGDIRFRIGNFGRDKIKIYKCNWANIKKSLEATFVLLEGLGFNNKSLKSKNAVLPIAYYIYKKGLSDQIIKTTYDRKDKGNISKWLVMSLLKEIFSGQSDNVINKIRNVIRENLDKPFPLDEIVDSFKGNPGKNYTFTDETLNGFIEAEYRSPVCEMILMLLYPNVVLEHGGNIAEDHRHPKTIFEHEDELDKLNLTEEQIRFYTDKKNYNSVANLQLLDTTQNSSKNDSRLLDWAKNKSADELYVDSTTSLDIKDFEDFISARKKNILKRLKQILGL